MSKRKHKTFNGFKREENPEHKIRELTAGYLQRLGVGGADLSKYVKLSDVKTPEGCLPHIFYVVQSLGTASKDPWIYLSLLYHFGSALQYLPDPKKGHASGWRCFCQEVKYVAEQLGGRELELKAFNDVLSTRQKFAEMTKNGYKSPPVKVR